MKKQKSLEEFIRTRSRELGLSLTEVCKKANISRETLYKLSEVPHRLPTLDTLIALADPLQVNPMQLTQLVFNQVPMSYKATKQSLRGDKSVFVSETIPEGTLVLSGKRFVKTWTMLNAGSVPWENRYMQCMDEEIVAYSRSGVELFSVGTLITDSKRVAVPYTAPGENVTIRIEFTAPKTPSVYFSYWKSVFEDGSLCFASSQGLSVTVRVNTMIVASSEVR